MKRDTIQDASFITSDPGLDPADKPRGDAAKIRRCRDGPWARKGTKSDFATTGKIFIYIPIIYTVALI
jgi:IS5 family transposase